MTELRTFYELAKFGISQVMTTFPIHVARTFHPRGIQPLSRYQTVGAPIHIPPIL